MKGQDSNILGEVLRDPESFLEPERPCPASVTPFIINADVYDKLCCHTRNIYSSINKIVAAYVEDKEVRKLFPEYQPLEKFSTIRPPFDEYLQLARFDLACLKNDEFRMMETNAGCPGALTTVGIINNYFLGTPVYRNIAKGRKNRDLLINKENYFSEFLVQLFQNERNTHRLPTIAFISSLQRKIVTDLDKLTSIGRSHGLHCIRCDVQELSYEKGQLLYEKTPIDVAYLKFDTVIDEEGVCDLAVYGPGLENFDAPLLRAMKDESIIYINSLPSILVAENKKMMALLHDHNFQKMLSKDEVHSINSLVAKTSYLEENGQPWAWSKDEIIGNKDQFVIKSAIDSRGRGVFIGKYLSEMEWQNRLAKCFDSPFVVQEFLNLSKQKVASPSDIGQEINAYTDIGLFHLAGEPIGFLCRASENPIVNVGNGGALRPTFVMEDI